MRSGSPRDRSVRTVGCLAQRQAGYTRSASGVPPSCSLIEVRLPRRRWSAAHAIEVEFGLVRTREYAAQPMQNQPAVAGAGSSKHLNSLLRLAVGVIRSPSHEGGRLAPSIQMSSRSFPARILSSHALPSCALGRRSEGRITDCRAPFGTRKRQRTRWIRSHCRRPRVGPKRPA